MSTILFITAAIILGIIVAAKIPGLEHFVRPLIDWLFKFLTWSIENGFAWSIFILKALWFAHYEVIRNLILPATAIDPTIAMREQQAAGPSAE